MNLLCKLLGHNDDRRKRTKKRVTYYCTRCGTVVRWHKRDYTSKGD